MAKLLPSSRSNYQQLSETTENENERSSAQAIQTELALEDQAFLEVPTTTSADNLDLTVEDDILEDAPTPKGVGATLSSSTFNLSNTILGSGVLAMPHACLTVGILPFISFTIISATAAHRAIVMLFETVERAGFEPGQRVSYATLGERVYGKRGRLIASWSVTLQQFGACIAYVVIFGDIFSPVFEGVYPGCEDSWCARGVLQSSILAFVVFPLCLLRHMDSLKYTSLVALACIVAFAFVTVVNGIMVLGNPEDREKLNIEDVSRRLVGMGHESFGWPRVLGGPEQNETLDPISSNEQQALDGVANGTSIHNDPIRWWPKSMEAFSVISFFAFAFLCHQNTFPIYNELRNPTVKRMSIISRSSMLICGTVYMLVGLFGYFTFLEATKPDIFKDFRVTGTYLSGMMDVVRIGFGFSLVFSYPIVVWEARSNLNDILYGEVPYDFWQQFRLNAAIVLFTGVVGISASNIDQVMGIVGATCSPMMMFVLPPLFHIKSGAAAASNSHWQSLTMFLIGTALIPISIATWVLTEVLHIW